MNELNPGIAPVEPAPWPEPYKDRSAGLVVFGIFTILLGGVAGLFIPLMLLGQAAAARGGNAAAPFSALLPGLCIYGILAVALIWLGVGSILARRWARALLLIFSWSWLIMGTVMTVIMACFLPKMMANIPASAGHGQPAIPPGAIAAAMIFTTLFMGVVFVALPALWVFFYHSRHVKATCEVRDPAARWTDLCPLPVLGFCMWLALSTVMMLIIPFMVHGVFPFFGFFLSGLPGIMMYLLSAAVWGWSACLLYRLDARGWWIILVAICIFTLSAILTYARHDLLEMYQLMGYPQSTIDQIQKTGLLAAGYMQWLTALSMVPFLFYLLFIKKYLRPKP